jgi:ribokinase
MSEGRQAGPVVFIASIFRDLVAVSPRFPRPGETLLGSRFFMGFGGKGANQCVMAARLGATATIVGKVGDDEHGLAYRANLEQLGVDTRHLGTEPGASTGIASILVESSTGENMIVIVPGANAALGEGDVRAAERDIRGAAVVVGVLEVGLPALVEAFTTARCTRPGYSPLPPSGVTASLLS